MLTTYVVQSLHPQDKEAFNAKLQFNLNEVKEKIINSDIPTVLGKYLRRIEVGEEDELYSK